MYKVCQWCEGTFKTDNRKRKYCSSLCSHKKRKPEKELTKYQWAMYYKLIEETYLSPNRIKELLQQGQTYEQILEWNDKANEEMYWQEDLDLQDVVQS